jgi:hypothetical protein
MKNLFSFGNKRTLEVKKNKDGEFYVEFPQEVIDELGWKIGENLIWENIKKDIWSLRVHRPKEKE